MLASTKERVISVGVLVLACAISALATAACGSRQAWEAADRVEYNAAIPEEGLAENGYLGRRAAAKPAAAGFLSAQDSAADAATGGDDAAQSAPKPESPAAARLRIYKARAEILVASVNESIAKFTALVEQEGGYVETRNDADVVCRVPVASFRKVIDAVKQFGVITRFSESAEDVTRQHLDLTIRLENAEKSRGRLLEILGKATETEAILKIEQEIRRLSDEIEQMQALLRNLDQQVAHSAIEAIFHANAPEQQEPVTRSGLFPWFDGVGVEPLANAMERSSPATPGFFAALFGNVREPPNGFIAVGTADDDDDYRAVAADRSKFRARIFEGSPEGDLAFWLAAFRSDFKDRRGYLVLEEKPVTIDDRPGNEFVIERTVRGQPLKYLFVISIADGRFHDDIHVTEYLAEKALFHGHLAAVRGTAKIGVTR